MTRILVDIEANSLLDDVTDIHCIVTGDLDTEEVRSYHDVPSFSPHHGSLSDGYTALEEAELLVGHNILAYDVPAIQKVANRLHIPYPKLASKLRDTLLMSRIAWPDVEFRNDLPWEQKRTKGKNGSVGPIQGYALEAFGKRMKCPKGDPGGSFEVFTQAMLTYCIQDVVLNYELWLRLNDPAYFLGMEPYGDSVWEQEHAFAWLMFLQQQHGWPFDIAAASELQATLQEKKDALYDQLATLVPPTVVVGKVPEYYMHPEYPGLKWTTKGLLQDYIREHKTERTLKERFSEIVSGPPVRKEIPWNPGSRAQITKMLYGQYNWDPTKWGKKKDVRDHVTPDEFEKLTDEGWHPIIDDDVLSSLGIPELEPLAEFMSVGKMLGMLALGQKAHMSEVGVDGRMHGTVNTAGVLGGRCSHMRPNVAQAPACNPKKPYNARFRALYGCLPGHKLVGFDAGALEYRMMAHFGYALDGGELARIVDDPELDIHWEFTKRYGLVQVPHDTPRDEHNEEWEGARSRSKGPTYGIPYGCQAPKLARMLEISKQEAEDLMDELRISLPGMIGLRDAITEAVEKRGKMVPGKWNKERYVPHSGWIKGMDGRYNVIRSAHASLNTKLQGDGGLYMKRLLIETIGLCQERGIRVFGIDCPWWDTNIAQYDVALVGNIHDESQQSVREDKIEAFCACVQDAFVRANEYYQLRCPVRGDCKVGQTWEATH